MAIVVQQPSVGTPAAGATLIGQNIVDCVSQDVRRLLSSSGADTSILLDYVNRIHAQIVRLTRWHFLLSEPLRFITEASQSDYWLGITGVAPPGTVDTGLNLSDVYSIKKGSVVDRTGFKVLHRLHTYPLSRAYATEDALGKPGQPAYWRQSANTPNILSIYPPPLHQSTNRPVPPAPQVTETSGGALAQRTYFIRLTYVDTLGNKSTPSDPVVEQLIAASNLAVVHSPPAVQPSTTGVKYDRYEVYVGTTEDNEQLQTASPIVVGTNWTEPAGGLIAGAAPPTSNGLVDQDGRVVEFRYYRQMTQILNLSDVLQVPDRYRDIVCAGVNLLAHMFLKRPTDVEFWSGVYQTGLREILRDVQYAKEGEDFIAPDPASLWQDARFLDVIENPFPNFR